MHLYIFLIFIFWRILLFVASWFGSFFLPFIPRFPYSDIFLIPSLLPSWVWSFANFDGVHYMTIAAQSYKAQFTQVFFPLFPLLISIFQKIFFFLPPLLVGLSVSNLIFLICLIIFHKLLILDYQKNEISWIFLFILFFPTSFYFGSLYTESLFLLLTLLAFYFARKEKWFISSLFASFAAATRLIGIFLLPALLSEWLLNKKRSILFSPILYISPLGLLLYMLYLYLNFGDPLYFWHAQPVFGAERSGTGIIFLPQVFWRYLKILTSIPPTQFAFWIPLTELFSIIFGILLLLLAHKKQIRTSYLIFSWPALILPTFTGTFSSMPRYLLIIFPIFIVLALLESKILKLLILLTFSILLLVFTVLFTRGFWVA